MQEPKKILVIRNDKIGDFMLAWPALSLLKKQFPDAEITALVPDYTAELAEHCEYIDKIIVDQKKTSALKDILLLSKKISSGNFDLSISFYSEFRTSLALFIARIKHRVGPATKLAQIFLNKTLKQKRSRSIKPEFEYNIDLTLFVIEAIGQKPVSRQSLPYLKFDTDETNIVKAKLYTEQNITSDKKLLIIHPGTGGSANNLSLTQYSDIAKLIASKKNVYFIITAGPNEIDVAKSLSLLMNDVQHHIHKSNNGLLQFCKFISISDIFISGSTGPLHIAGALNIRTAAYYPAKKSATALRWQTLNEKNRRIAISPITYIGEHDAEKIDIDEYSDEIIKKFIS